MDNYPPGYTEFYPEEPEQQEPDNDPMPPLNWDKTKPYLSPSGEMAAIFIEDKWVLFYRQDCIQKHFSQSLI